jgi:rhodanese-related sulfurtransferase
MRVNKEEVLEKIKFGNAVVINVLSKENFNKLHIEGSQNHPLKDDAKVFSKEVEEKYGKDKLFIVYGDHFGHLESFEATEALTAHGLEAFNYAGGVQEWFKAGYPVEGTETSGVGVV